MDKASKDKETGLSKRYVSGLSRSIKKARAAHWARTKKMDPGNPAAYEPAPGDETAETKKSKYTRSYRAKFGEGTEMEEDYIDEDATSGLAKKAKESGISIGTLRKVYNRGMAAWRTGHRPGTTPQQWAMARVNSYIMKGKGTYGGADKDLHEDLDEACWAGYKKIGMKKKGKKMVPDCVPESYQKTEPQSKNKNDSSSRFDNTNSLVNIYKDDTPGQSKKTKNIIKQSIREMLESQCSCGGNCECDKPKSKKIVDENKEYENPTGGLSQKGRDHYNSTTGSHLQAPVTKKPSKLKKGSKSYNRRKSFCARMGGMKKRLTSAKTANDPDSRINKALRKWNC